MPCGLRPQKKTEQKRKKCRVGTAHQKKKDLLTFFWKKESKTKKTNASGPSGRWKNPW